jgi:hypothetical protein
MDYGTTNNKNSNNNNNNTNNQSHVRKRWNAVLQETTIAQQALEYAKAEWERTQANVEAARLNLQQSQEVVPKVLNEIYLPLLQEDPPWFDLYQTFQAFQATHGHTNVPRKSTAANNKLCRWIGINRRLYKKQQLDQPKLYALNQLGYFDWDPCESKWKARHQQLEQFVQANGHARVPYDEDGLGAWVKRQQYQFKLFQNQRPSEMSPHRMQLLNQLGMVWNRRSDSWMERYKHLQTFREQYGHVQVTSQLDPSLHEWVRDQRTQLKKYKRQQQQLQLLLLSNNNNNNNDNTNTVLSTLTKRQVELLEEIGLDLDLRDSKWQIKFEELREFQKIHGHCFVPNKYPKNQALANWCGTQRRQFKLLQQHQRQQLQEEEEDQNNNTNNTKAGSSTLNQDRIAKLLEIGFEFDNCSTQRGRLHSQLRTTWDEHYMELKAFLEAKGHLNVPKDSTLGNWWEGQQKALELSADEEGQSSSSASATACSGLLSKDQTKLLKDLLGLAANGRTSSSINLGGARKCEKSWEECCGELLAHRIYSNSFQIPSSRTDLQHWVEQQRQEFLNYHGGRPSQLTRARVARLQSVKFPFKAKGKRLRVVAPTWEEMYLELLQFRVQNNNFQVPPSHRALFQWIKDQHKIFQKRQQQEATKQDADDVKADAASGINKERIAKLRKVGFSFEQASAPSVLVRPKATIPASKTGVVVDDAPPLVKPSPSVITPTTQHEAYDDEDKAYDDEVVDSNDKPRQKQSPSTTNNMPPASSDDLPAVPTDVPPDLFYFPLASPPPGGAQPFVYFQQHPQQHAENHATYDPTDNTEHTMHHPGTTIAPRTG